MATTANIDTLPPELIGRISRMLTPKQFKALRRANKTLLKGTTHDFCKRYCKTLRVRLRVHALEVLLSLLQYEDIASGVQAVQFFAHHGPTGHLRDQEVQQMRRLLQQLLPKIQTATRMHISSVSCHEICYAPLDTLLYALIDTPLSQISRIVLDQGRLDVQLLRRYFGSCEGPIAQLGIHNAYARNGNWFDLLEFMRDHMVIEKLDLLFRRDRPGEWDSPLFKPGLRLVK